MIYYDIQHFGDPTWVPWLLKVLQDSKNSFRVSYDAPEAEVKLLSKDLNSADIVARRLLVERSIPIRWCGPSQIRGLIHAIRSAVAVEGWEFFINLSGSCFPLFSQEFLHQYLLSTLTTGYSTHFSWFQVRKPITLPEEDPKVPEVQTQVGRLHLRGNARLLEMFRDPNYLPVLRVANRLMVHCKEPIDEPNLLHVSRPSPDELSFRQEYLARYPHYCGRAWFVLHRTDCEEMVAHFESANFGESARLFCSAFEPDESFLQTLVMNDLVLSRDRVVPRNLHIFNGEPKWLDDSNIHLLENQKGAFFGRKINHSKAPQLRQLVEARCAVLGSGFKTNR